MSWFHLKHLQTLQRPNCNNLSARCEFPIAAISVGPPPGFFQISLTKLTKACWAVCLLVFLNSFPVYHFLVSQNHFSSHLLSSHISFRLLDKKHKCWYLRDSWMLPSPLILGCFPGLWEMNFHRGRGFLERVRPPKETGTQKTHKSGAGVDCTSPNIKICRTEPCRCGGRGIISKHSAGLGGNVLALSVKAFQSRSIFPHSSHLEQTKLGVKRLEVGGDLLPRLWVKTYAGDPLKSISLVFSRHVHFHTPVTKTTY